MHNIMRYIRQNRKKLIRIALIVVSLFGLLQFLNYMAKNNIETGKSNSNTNIYNTSNGTIMSEKSAVSGATVSTTKIENVNNTIKEFVDYCNNHNVEEAYNMLSDNCKEQIYPNIERFKSNYYEGLFADGSRTYNIENWTVNTYIVKYTGDLLATGKSADDFTYQDYITIEENNGQRKLNISKYIGREELNKTSSSNNIVMTALYKEKYMDYEIYKIKITNNTDSTILLDELIDTDTIYLKDSNNVKHVSYSNEIVKENLKVYRNETKTIEIKFDNPYISGRKINNLCFSNILLDYTSNNYAGANMIKFTINL